MTENILKPEQIRVTGLLGGNSHTLYTLNLGGKGDSKPVSSKTRLAPPASTSPCCEEQPAKGGHCYSDLTSKESRHSYVGTEFDVHQKLTRSSKLTASLKLR